MRWLRRKNRGEDNAPAPPPPPKPAAPQELSDPQRGAARTRAAGAREKREQLLAAKARQEAIARAEETRREAEANALPAELGPIVQERIRKINFEKTPDAVSEAVRNEFAERQPGDDELMVYLLRQLCSAYDESQAASGARMAAAWVAEEPGGPKKPPADVDEAYMRARADVERFEAVATVIGEELNRSGGKSEMLRVFELVGPREGLRTLEMHWNGIGEWLG